MKIPHVAVDARKAAGSVVGIGVHTGAKTEASLCETSMKGYGLARLWVMMLSHASFCPRLLSKRLILLGGHQDDPIASGLQISSGTYKISHADPLNGSLTRRSEVVRRRSNARITYTTKANQLIISNSVSELGAVPSELPLCWTKVR